MEYSSEIGADLFTLHFNKQTKEPAQGPSIALPPEFLSFVCGILPRFVLKELRLVSKTWERAAVPFLFDQIFMSLNMSDLRIAKLVILQFKQYIRTLVFSSVYYLDTDQDSFDDYFDWAFGEEDPDTDTDTDTYIGHLDHAFKLYLIARKNQQESIDTGLSSAYLSYALTSCPNIRKIVLTDSFSSRPMSRESLQIFEPRRSNNCPVEECHLEDTDHFPLEVLQSGFLRRGSSNPWRLILQALSVTSSRVNELTMVPEDEEETPLDTSAFSMSPGDLRQAKICFHVLTKIRVSFVWDPEQFSTDVDIRHTHRNFAKLLRCAVNLEHLALVAYEDTDTTTIQNCPLQDVLGGCTFPKLKSLILGFFEFTEVELLNLLTYSRGLQRLTINCPILKEGLWVRIVDWSQGSLPYLKSAQLNQLYGGFEDPWADTEYMDVYGNVSDFLFGRGENPFTTEALAKYHDDWERRRKWVLPSGGKSYLDLCVRHHLVVFPLLVSSTNTHAS